MNNGNYVHEANPFYTQAVNEHRELHAAVQHIEETLHQCEPCEATAERLAEAKQLIVTLRDHLAHHFAQEEQGGYLEEAIIRVPQMSHQADMLQRQHAEFLRLANNMLADAQAGVPQPTAWRNLKADYLQFAKRLKAHEAAENALLQRAFNEDNGVEL